MSDNSGQNFLREAIRLSREKMEANAGGPFGAVIVRDGEILARGWNQVTSKNDPTAHAEIVAIRTACEVLNSFTLNGCEIFSSCEPCPMCLAAIYWARIDRITFAATQSDAADADFDDHHFYEELRKPVEQRMIPVTQSLRDEAIVVFEMWRRKLDRIRY